jgi:hypothetical protein
VCRIGLPVGDNAVVGAGDSGLLITRSGHQIRQHFQRRPLARQTNVGNLPIVERLDGKSSSDRNKLLKIRT